MLNKASAELGNAAGRLMKGSTRDRVRRVKAELDAYIDGHPREAQSGATASLPKPPVTADEGWIEWTGGECPVGRSEKVAYRLRNGQENEDPYEAGCLSWRHHGEPYDIIAYRLVKGVGCD